MGARPETREGVGALARRHALGTRHPAIRTARLLNPLEQLGIKNRLVHGWLPATFAIREFAEVEPGSNRGTGVPAASECA
jgi:hypothetical protein